MKKNNNIAAIIAMIFLMGMIAFVTNLAAPVGVIWKQHPSIGGSNFLGMMGNMMNFLAYLFMGIPAGKLITRVGYKKTAILGVVVGIAGLFIQFLSGVVGVESMIAGLPTNFYVYLLGALVAGFSMCILNVVANPMLNLIGGGGKKGNQYVQIGGTFNSLMGTLAPMLVGALIGSVTKDTVITDINPVIFIGIGVFALALIVLILSPIEDPDFGKAEDAESPWKYRHFAFGAVAIFMYVGTEVGIPGTLNFYLSDSVKGAGLDPANAATIAGFVAGTYWFLMLIGRFVSSLISGKISSRTQITVLASAAIALVLCSMFFTEVQSTLPVFTGKGFAMVQVPLAATLLVLCGLCTSVMFGGIFNLAVEGLKPATAALASGAFMTMIVGGGILPLVQNAIADATTYMTSYWVPVVGFSYILWFAVMGSKMKK